MLTSFAAEPDETIHDPSERQSSASDTPMVDRPPIERETDPVRLALRQKQIDYGRNTRGRSMRTKDDPWTPDKSRKYSRRAWDGLIKSWRRKLHRFDPTDDNDDDDERDYQRFEK